MNEAPENILYTDENVEIVEKVVTTECGYEAKAAMPRFKNIKALLNVLPEDVAVNYLNSKVQLSVLGKIRRIENKLEGAAAVAYYTEKAAKQDGFSYTVEQAKHFGFRQYEIKPPAPTLRELKAKLESKEFYTVATREEMSALIDQINALQSRNAARSAAKKAREAAANPISV